MSEQSPRRILVACRDANGIPTLHPVVVSATDTEVEQGQHYRSAEKQARSHGFELPSGPVVSIDTSDAKTGGFEAQFDDFFDPETKAVETGRLMPQSDIRSSNAHRTDGRESDDQD